MAAEYPLAKKIFPVRVARDHSVRAEHMNTIQEEIRALQDFLGTVSKTAKIGIMDMLSDYRRAIPGTIPSGDTISLPAQEMIIDGRAVQNTTVETRDLATDIAASTDTDYYLYAVDDGDGTFSLLYRTSSADNFLGERKIATVHTATTGSPPDIDYIIDDDVLSTEIEYVRLHDAKTAGTDGGTFTSGAWQKRTVTEHKDDNNNCTVTSSVIVLAAGTYDCLITCPAHQVAQHQARLYNTTDAEEVPGTNGTSEYAGATGAFATTCSIIRGRFTIAASKNLEIQHRCASTKATIGFGVSAGYGANDVYTVAEFWKMS